MSIISITEGTLGLQGAVSGTDQTPVALTNANQHTAPNVLRIWVENQTGTSTATLQSSYDSGTGVIQTTAGKPVVVSGALGEDFRVVGSGNFTEALTIGPNSTYLNERAITTASGVFLTSLTISGVPVATGTSSGASVSVSERQVPFGDASNQLTSSANLTFTGSGPMMGLGVGGDITVTGTVAGTKASFASYPGLVESVTGQWMQPGTGTLCLDRSAAYDYTIQKFTAKTASNSTLSSLTVQGVSIPGLSNLVLSSTVAAYTPSSTAAVATGQTLLLTSSGSTGAEDLSFTLVIVRM